jgi:hypothetical protein
MSAAPTQTQRLTRQPSVQDRVAQHAVIANEWQAAIAIGYRPNNAEPIGQG